VQKRGEGQLVLAVLIDVRNPQLRFPEPCVVGTPERLPLLGDGTDNGL
jgi:hypothetical protein